MNLDVLRALGVRFVITDGIIAAPDTALRQTLARPGAVTLRLYELYGANLATYSPVELIETADRARIISEISQTPRQLKVRAFVQGTTAGSLVPAASSEMAFVRNGIRVEARSGGRSALLLPVQFSHCLTVREEGPASGTKLMRANLLEALVVFERSVKVQIDWKFDFWRSAACRKADVDDLRMLGM